MRIIFFLISLLLVSQNVTADTDKLSLKKVALNSSRINFIVQVPERCMFGDFDAIRLDMVHSTAGSLKFSIQSSSNNQEIVSPFLDEITYPKNSEELKKTYNLLISGDYKFSIDLGNLTEKLAFLKVCKSSRNTCRLSKINDLNQVVKKYNTTETNLKSEDNTYFYQPIIINKEQILYFSDTIHSKNIQEAKTILKELNLGLGSSQIDKYLNDISIINSMPFINQEGSLLIRLPVYSKKKCTR